MAASLSLIGNPPVGYRFMVVFFVGGTDPNPLDIRFKKVSGLTATIETEEVREGGENLYSHKLPKRISPGTLKLERGMVIDSPLNLEFNDAMNLLELKPGNVLVILLSEDMIPLAGWHFFNAYPVKWAVSDLDGTSKDVAVDTMELAYSRMQIVRV